MSEVKEEDIQYYSLLSEEDQLMIKAIRSKLKEPSLKNKRNTRVSDLEEVLKALKLFQDHKMEDKWKRCLISGVVQIDESSYAVNIKQLQKLIYKCKSSINGTFKRMGYSSITNSDNSLKPLIEMIPFLQNNYHELKQWNLRVKQLREEEIVDFNNDDPYFTNFNMLDDNYDFF